MPLCQSQGEILPGHKDFAFIFISSMRVLAFPERTGIPVGSEGNIFSAHSPTWQFLLAGQQCETFDDSVLTLGLVPLSREAKAALVKESVGSLCLATELMRTLYPSL